MKKYPNLLEQLKNEKSANISKLLQWTDLDFVEMLETYHQAREVANESKVPVEIAIIEEKISQMEEAQRLKAKGVPNDSPR